MDGVGVRNTNEKEKEEPRGHDQRSVSLEEDSMTTMTPVFQIGQGDWLPRNYHSRPSINVGTSAFNLTQDERRSHISIRVLVLGIMTVFDLYRRVANKAGASKRRRRVLVWRLLMEAEEDDIE